MSTITLRLFESDYVFTQVREYLNGDKQTVRQYVLSDDEVDELVRLHQSTMWLFEIVGVRFVLDFVNHSGGGNTAEEAATDLEQKLKPLAKLLAPLVEVEG